MVQILKAPVEAPELAKVCGNCAHPKYGFLILRGRLKIMLEDLQPLDSEIILTTRVVDAVGGMVKIGQWSALCPVEKTRVKMLDRGCASWQPYERRRS